MENDNQIIIDLLREQNRTLHQLLAFHQKKERADFRNAVIHFFIQAIPYIALVIVVYFIYITIKGYLDAIHAQISALQDSYTGLQNNVQELIGKITAIPGNIGNSLSNLNPFN